MSIRRARISYAKIVLALFCAVSLAFGDWGVAVAAAPTVITNPATNITKTSAIITGTITSDGGSTITDTGFEFGTSPSFGQSVAGNEQYQQTDEFGTVGSGASEFNDPRDVDIDSSGNIYVVDRLNDRVQKFNASHAWQYDITSGDLPGDSAFDNPRGIAVLGNDTVVIYDDGGAFNGELLFIDTSGTFIDCYGLGTSCSYIQSFANTTSLAASGVDNLYYAYSVSGGGQSVVGLDNAHASIYEISSVSPTNAQGGLSSPSGVYVDGADNVYVTETGNHRLQKFNAAETLVFQIGRSDEASGSADGELNSPEDVALDSHGDIFIVDNGNNRVQKFDPSGAFVSKFGTMGTGDDELTSPTGIAIDAADDIYITDSGNNRVVKYELGFTADLSVVLPALTCGTAYYYRAFATNADGTSYGTSEQFETLPCDTPIVRTTGYSGFVEPDVTFSGTHEGQGSLDLSARGFEYGPTMSYGSTYSESGNLFVDEFGGAGGGGGNGTFIILNSVGSDSSGNYYTTDIAEDLIQKFDSDGVFLGQYAVSMPNPGGLTTPVAVKGDAAGHLFAVDAVNSQIVRFDDNTFANPTVFGVAAGFSGPTDIAFDSAGNVYVADAGNARMVKLSSAGTVLMEIVEPLAGITLASVSAVAVSETGNIYVYDSIRHQIYKFDPTGVYDRTSGGTIAGGSEESEFGGNAYIFVDGDGFVYAADANNNRVQKFDEDLNFESMFGMAGSGDGEFSGPSGIALGLNGDFAVADQNNSRLQVFNERFSGPASLTSCGTTYHFRAFATAPDGTGYGDDMTIDTAPCVDDPAPSGGGGGSSATHFICTDPKALNYTADLTIGKVNNDRCKYPEAERPNELACDTSLYLTRPVKYGAANDPHDVKLLEKYLNTYEGYALPVDGVYSKTDYTAVIKWQEKYSSEILRPWGIVRGTGYVFITSLRKIKSIHEAECARAGVVPASTSCYLYDQVLKKGDKSNFVKFAQKALRASGTLADAADGIFGAVTERAVQDFQKKKGMTADGIIGPSTGKVLEGVSCDIY